MSTERHTTDCFIEGESALQKQRLLSTKGVTKSINRNMLITAFTYELTFMNAYAAEQEAWHVSQGRTCRERTSAVSGAACTGAHTDG